MKKGFLASVAICSLLFMAACGGNGTAKEASAETKTAAEQPAEKAAEPKTEVEAAPAAETLEPEVTAEQENPAEAVSESVTVSKTLDSFTEEDVSDADQQKLDQYMNEYDSVTQPLEPTINQMVTVITAVKNKEIDVNELKIELTKIKDSFTEIRHQFETIALPQLEFTALNDKFVELHDHTLSAIVAGEEANSLMLTALETENEDKLDEALEAFERMSQEGEAISAVSEELLAAMPD
ncbi:hypothetical protein CDO73_12405 [Saccharibacillus sp. O23]|uniref:hypothetical protein n=1 Tax=Saccharibacillus sp. O23 TaxID=2009338 RepID=UPI000B4E1FBB|nr:hypothetical protein [Saccharibacillus sp. O23]OWR29879.1 hypothetical protein CDO73_12405 [Saccharibacillus sp. O23]